MKRILLAISGTYPYGVAYSARARALIKLIQLSGYEIDILCDYPNYGEDGIAPELINNLFYVNESPYNRSMTFLLLPFVYTEKLRIVCRLRKIVDYVKKDCILVGTKYGNRARNNMDKKAFLGILRMSH